MKTNNRVQEILSWYRGCRNPGVIRNLYAMLNTGRLAGSGYLNPYPVDQGIEHSAARSFAPNPVAYDPSYHAAFAVKAGCSAYAAPLGFIEAVASDYPELPFILKLNSKEAYTKEEPLSALMCGVADAVRLGCAAVGFTVYPGSGESTTMYEQLRELTCQAHDAGLVVVVWAYPRGKHVQKENESALDITAYGAHLACQMGADIIKVKPPKALVQEPAAAKSYPDVEKSTLKDRIAHVVQCCFAGKRIVLFSGGEKKDDEGLLTEIKEIAAGGGFGSIMGRNCFQRPEADALQLVRRVQDIYLEAADAKA